MRIQRLRIVEAFFVFGIDAAKVARTFTFIKDKNSFSNQHSFFSWMYQQMYLLTLNIRINLEESDRLMPDEVEWTRSGLPISITIQLSENVDITLPGLK